MENRNGAGGGPSVSLSTLSEALNDNPSGSDRGTRGFCACLVLDLIFLAAVPEGSVLQMSLSPPCKVTQRSCIWDPPWLSGPECGPTSWSHNAPCGCSQEAPWDTWPVGLLVLDLLPAGHFLGCASWEGLVTSGVCRQGKQCGQVGSLASPAPPRTHSATRPIRNHPAVLSELRAVIYGSVVAGGRRGSPRDLEDWSVQVSAYPALGCG